MRRSHSATPTSVAPSRPGRAGGLSGADAGDDCPERDAQDDEVLDEPVLQEESRRYRQAFDRALRLLGQREHSVGELTAKLVGKGVDAATAGLVVDDLRGRGLQSDARFVEAFVHSRLSRGQGPIRIRQELSQRGIGDDQADEWLTRSGEFWQHQAQQVRRRRFGRPAPEGRDDWQRQARFLAQRGFPSDVIYQVLGHLTD